MSRVRPGAFASVGNDPRFMLPFALEHAGKTHPVHRFPFVIGRAQDSDLIVGSDAVSRRHAQIVQAERGFEVEDLGSRNGVLLNARKIRGRARIGIGDTLTLGDESIGIVEAVDPPRTMRSLETQKAPESLE